LAKLFIVKLISIYKDGKIALIGSYIFSDVDFWPTREKKNLSGISKNSLRRISSYFLKISNHLYYF